MRAGRWAFCYLAEAPTYLLTQLMDAEAQRRLLELRSRLEQEERDERELEEHGGRWAAPV